MFTKMMKVASLAILSTSMAWSMSVTELNKASKDMLMHINGIGAKKAESIINYREKTSFQNIDDVVNVKGIGIALAKNIKNDIFKKSIKSKKNIPNTKTTGKKVEEKKETTKTTVKK